MKKLYEKPITESIELTERHVLLESSGQIKPEDMMSKERTMYEYFEDENEDLHAEYKKYSLWD